MSQSVNKVILIGFLGGAPEVRFTPQGKPVGTFSVAVNESWKDAQGARQERVEWFRIVCFGRLAEVCGEYLSKGRQIYVEGKLRTRKWDDREGQKRTTVEVVASQMRILDQMRKNGNSTSADGPIDSQPQGTNDPGDEPFRDTFSFRDLREDRLHEK